MKTIFEYMMQASNFHLAPLNEYLSTKVKNVKSEFPKNFNLEDIKAFLTANSFNNCYYCQSIDNKHLASVTAYILNNTPYSSISNDLETFIYVKENDGIIFVLTFEKEKKKLACYCIALNEKTRIIVVDSYGSKIDFDRDKVYKNYGLSSNIVLTYHAFKGTYGEFRRYIHQLLEHLKS